MELYVKIFIWIYIVIGSLSLLAILVWALINSAWKLYNSIVGAKTAMDMISFYKKYHTKGITLGEEHIIK